MFLASAEFSQKLTLFFNFKNICHEYHQIVKHFGPSSGPTFVGSDLGPNILQSLSQDGTTIKQEVKVHEACHTTYSRISLIHVHKIDLIRRSQIFLRGR